MGRKSRRGGQRAAAPKKKVGRVKKKARTVAPKKKAPEPKLNNEQLVQEAILKESSEIGERIAISDIRRNLPGMSRQEQDAAIMKLEREGLVSTFQLDNPDDITPAIQAGAAFTPAGSIRHILYIADPWWRK